MKVVTMTNEEPTGTGNEEQEPTPTPSNEEPTPTPSNEEPGPDTFSREYVEEIRRDTANYRERARNAESALWQALVAATGRVVNPDEVPRPDGAPVSRETVDAAVEQALADRPYIAAKRANGNIGQHDRNETAPAPVSLAALLRQGA